MSAHVCAGLSGIADADGHCPVQPRYCVSEPNVSGRPPAPGTDLHACGRHLSWLEGPGPFDEARA